ncbi:hypothetical protein SHO565_49410 [Streptomyces sp. HO565]
MARGVTGQAQGRGGADGDERGGQAVHEGGPDAACQGRALGAELIGDEKARRGGVACGFGGEQVDGVGQVGAVAAAVDRAHEGDADGRADLPCGVVHRGGDSLLAAAE